MSNPRQSAKHTSQISDLPSRRLCAMLLLCLRAQTPLVIVVGRTNYLRQDSNKINAEYVIWKEAAKISFKYQTNIPLNRLIKEGKPRVN